jgi:hypothetical protein
MEIKPEVPCRKILLPIEDPLRYFRYWQVKFSLLRPFLLLAEDVSACRTARELWWTIQALSPAVITTTMALHAHISPGGCIIGPLVAAVLRHSLTPSQSINQSINRICRTCESVIASHPHYCAVRICHGTSPSVNITETSFKWMLSS